MISIISHYHFVCNNVYKKRLINLGQEPRKIFNIGSLSIDKILNYKLLNKKEFCEIEKLSRIKNYFSYLPPTTK